MLQTVAPSRAQVQTRVRSPLNRRQRSRHNTLDATADGAHVPGLHAWGGEGRALPSHRPTTAVHTPILCIMPDIHQPPHILKLVSSHYAARWCAHGTWLRSDSASSKRSSLLRATPRQ